MKTMQLFGVPILILKLIFANEEGNLSAFSMFLEFYNSLNSEKLCKIDMTELCTKIGTSRSTYYDSNMLLEQYKDSSEVKELVFKQHDFKYLMDFLSEKSTLEKILSPFYEKSRPETFVSKVFSLQNKFIKKKPELLITLKEDIDFVFHYLKKLYIFNYNRNIENQQEHIDFFQDFDCSEQNCSIFYIDSSKHSFSVCFTFLMYLHHRIEMFLENDNYSKYLQINGQSFDLNLLMNPILEASQLIIDFMNFQSEAKDTAKNENKVNFNILKLNEALEAKIVTFMVYYLKFLGMVLDMSNSKDISNVINCFNLDIFRLLVPVECLKYTCYFICNVVRILTNSQVKIYTDNFLSLAYDIEVYCQKNKIKDIDYNNLYMLKNFTATPEKPEIISTSEFFKKFRLFIVLLDVDFNNFDQFKEFINLLA